MGSPPRSQQMGSLGGNPQLPLRELRGAKMAGGRPVMYSPLFFLTQLVFAKCYT